MPFYLTLTTPSSPDPVAVLAAVKAATDANAVLVPGGAGTWRGKKATTWTAPQIASAQNIIDTTVAVTPQLEAQRTIDSFPIAYRALILALVDAINVLRTHAAIGLPAVTPAAAIASIRTKAGTL